MKNFKKTLAGVSALAFAMSMTACGGGSESGGDTTTAPVETTTGATVEINTATVAEEDQQTLDKMAEENLQDIELENKTIKWLAHYDINPSTDGKSENIALNLFKNKYGGEIQWYTTTWDTRYSDLSTYVLGGEGIDFFPADTAALPKGVVNGMFQPVDDLIDINSPLWEDMKEAYEIHNYNGKHYQIVNSVTAAMLCIYNTETIAENGYEDPWDLYKAGEWNWDKFTSMLEDFVDPDAERYGLDNWYNEQALYMSAGVPAISSENGSLKVNIMDPTLEKAMNFQYDLYNKGLVLDLSLFDWSIQPQFMGEKKELFWIGGPWEVNTAPDTWTTQIPPENLGFAPVPSPAGSDPYQYATLDGWVICKGASNPTGVAMFAECTRLASLNDEAIAISDAQRKADAGWSDELIAREKEINALAQQYPVVDLATGVSTDVASITTDGGSEIGLRAAFHGTDWATTRDEIGSVVETLTAEVDEQLKALA